MAPLSSQRNKAKQLLWSVFESLHEKEAFWRLQNRLHGIVDNYTEHPRNRYEVDVRFQGEGIKGLCYVYNSEPSDLYSADSSKQKAISDANYVILVRFDLSKAFYKDMVDCAQLMGYDTFGQPTPFKWEKGTSFGLKGRLTYKGSNAYVKFESSFLGERVVTFKIK